MCFALFALVLAAFQALAHFVVSPPASGELALLHDIGHDSFKTGAIVEHASFIEHGRSTPESRAAVTLDLTVLVSEQASGGRHIIRWPLC